DRPEAAGCARGAAGTRAGGPRPAPPGVTTAMSTIGKLPTEHLELDWAMFGELCRALALKVARDYDPEVVLGIARAGAIPAAIVASILRVDFYSMTISRRHGDEVRERPEVLSAAPRDVAGKRVLIVDEITSSGDTL